MVALWVVTYDGLGLLALRVVQAVRPQGLELAHVLGVDLLERAVALVVVAHAVSQHVVRGGAVVFKGI
jgi:hypothetical protein